MDKTKTKKLYQSPDRERNLAKYGDNSNSCVCCGRPLKEGPNKFVHMNTAWVAVNPHLKDEEVKEITGHESQGWFPLGPDCAKKMVGFIANGSL